MTSNNKNIVSLTNTNYHDDRANCDDTNNKNTTKNRENDSRHQQKREIRSVKWPDWDHDLNSNKSHNDDIVVASLVTMIPPCPINDEHQQEQSIDIPLLWYTKYELKSFKEKIRATVKLLRSGKKMKGITKSSTIDVCPRGIEHLIDPNLGQARKERIQQVQDIIMVIQQKQDGLAKLFHHDSENWSLSSLAYRELTNKSLQIANTQGLSDRAKVIEMTVEEVANHASEDVKHLKNHRIKMTLSMSKLTNKSRNQLIQLFRGEAPCAA